MAITRVQGNAKGTWSSGSTLTVTLTNTPVSGNLLVLVFGSAWNKTVSSISQTNVTWAAGGNGEQIGLNDGTNGMDVEIWLGTVGAGASKTITVTMSGTPVAALADVCEYSGLNAASGVLDQTAVSASGQMSQITDSGTTSTTTEVVELWIAAIHVLSQDTGSVAQSAPQNSFTLLDGANTTIGTYRISLGFLERIVSATGAANTKTTQPSAGHTWDGCIATFKAPSSTPISVADAGSGAEVPSIGLRTVDAGSGSETSIAIGPKATDSGVGSDVRALTVTFTSADSGQLTDVLTTVNVTIPTTDTGHGVDLPSVQVPVTVSDSGHGVEVLALTVSVTVTQAGSGVDAIGVTAYTYSTDSGVGLETKYGGYTAYLTIYDANLFVVENVTTPSTITILDAGLFAEFAWRTKPTNPMIDVLALPHVQSIITSDPASMVDKKVQGGSLPRRKMVGKEGRTVTIEGWTDEQSEIDALQALFDGATRTFYHPSGDSFAVLVTAFNPSLRVDEYDRRIYSLTLAEK